MTTITLHWATASSADDTHDDISADISDTLLGIVSQDACPDDPSLAWTWAVEDWSWDEDNDDYPAEPLILAHGYTATKQEGRSTILRWVRENRTKA